MIEIEIEIGIGIGIGIGIETARGTALMIILPSHYRVGRHNEGGSFRYLNQTALRGLRPGDIKNKNPIAIPIVTFDPDFDCDFDRDRKHRG